MSSALFPATCFGKLPGFADFVRFNAAGRETIAFDQWIQQGLFHTRTVLGTQWEVAFENAPGYQFVFLPENAGRLLVGILSPSQDRSNRKYPFLVSLLVDRPRFGDTNVQLAPFAFTDFFVRAGRLVTRAKSGSGMPELAEQTEELGVASADAISDEFTKHTQYLEQTDWRSFLLSALGTFDEGKRYLLFANLAESVLPLRRHSAARFALGLRFPVSSSSTLAGHEVSFWVQVALSLSGAGTVVPIMFWPWTTDEKPGHVLLFFRQPSPKVFLQLVKPDLASDGICVLDREGDGSIERTRGILDRAFRTVLDDPDQKLSDFLARLSKLF